MVHPCSLELYTGSGEDLGLVNDDGGELMRIFKWRHPQHGPSVFGIVKGHALHDSRQLFKVLSLLQLHVVHSRILACGVSCTKAAEEFTKVRLALLPDRSGQRMTRQSRSLAGAKRVSCDDQLCITFVILSSSEVMPTVCRVA